MEGSATASEAIDPVQSYLGPIRSVLFVDDRFPTYDEPNVTEGDESIRARALWSACIARGWLCDMDNTADWSTEAKLKRLSGCDLLVLDYHLVGDDPRPALAIIHRLAETPSPNLVVVYTADPDLDTAIVQICAAARGASLGRYKQEIDVEYEDLQVDWSSSDIREYLLGQDGWKRSFIRACQGATVEISIQAGETLMERFLVKNMAATALETPRRIDEFGSTQTHWFQCGNLFVALVAKPRVQDAATEAGVLFDGLNSAVLSWSPHWLACLIASSRRVVEDGAFRDDCVLPLPALQAGLLRYIAGAADSDESLRRAFGVASHLLEQRYAGAAQSMSESLLSRTDSLPENTEGEVCRQLLHLNAFLCAGPFRRHHLRLGTVFWLSGAERAYVCVTPACDMVPRQKSKSVDPYAFEIDPARPTLCLRLGLVPTKEIADALVHAERGRHIFFMDPRTMPATPVAASVAHQLARTPKLEQLFARDRGRVRDGKLSIIRLISDSGNGGLKTVDSEAQVLAQLRAPYAERLSHMVGAHVSRVGVDFLSMPVTKEPTEST